LADEAKAKKLAEKAAEEAKALKAE